MTYNIRSGAIRCPTSYLMATVMFALSLVVYEINANQDKCQKLNIQNEGRGQGVQKNRTCAIRLEMSDSL